MAASFSKYRTKVQYKCVAVVCHCCVDYHLDTSSDTETNSSQSV